MYTPPLRQSLLAFVLLLGAAAPAQAQWTYHGLAGPFLRALQLHDGYLYAANDRGLYRKPAAGADTTWTPLGLTGQHVRAFEVLSPDTLLAVVYVYEDGHPAHQQLYRTVDGGAQWTPVAAHLRTDAPEMLFGFIRRMPGQPRTLFAGGSGAIAKSEDGGDTWRPVEGAWDSFGMGVHFIAFDPLRPHVLWSGGESAILWPFLLRSDDAGEHWAWRSLDLGGDNAVYALAFDPADSTRLYIGTEGAVLGSIDGGETWIPLLSPPTYEYFVGLAVSSRDPARLYAAGIRNALDQRLTLYVSDDRGASWTTIPYGEPSVWFGVEQMAVGQGPAADQVYLGTRYDGVYAYTAPRPTGTEAGTVLPARYELDQNYPNPFNPATAISFTLGAAAHVRLTVYDATGRAVARLIDGPLPAGSHRAAWHAANRPSGTYLYRLEAGPFSATRRMVLLK
jgi:hypothetical protein